MFRLNSEELQYLSPVDFKNFIGPGPVRDLEIFLGPGPVWSQVLKFFSVLVRSGLKFRNLFRSWSGSVSGFEF